MKLIIELTPQQLARLKKENKHNLPLTSFVKTAFKFKSVEIIKPLDLKTQEVLYRVNRAKLF